MPLDLTDFVDRGAVKTKDTWDGKHVSVIDPAGGAKLLQTIITNYFLDYSQGSEGKATKDTPSDYGVVAETGGLLGSTIKAGNLGKQSRIEYLNKDGSFFSSYPIDMENIYSDLGVLLHEIQHTRQHRNKDPELLKYGLGDDWRDMLSEAKDAGFPSVGRHMFQGDNLEEFLASAVVVKDMQSRGFPVTGRDMKSAAQALPKLEKKYPWLSDYIRINARPEVPTLKAAPPPQKSLLDTLRGFFK